MPVQSWVEHWLDRYCAPGEHDFRAVRAGVLVCQRCEKEELLGGSTCIVCGIPGEHPTVLVHTNGDVTKVPGKLCGPCLDDFVATPNIRGWHMERAG
jgi:hypothetical protein